MAGWSRPEVTGIKNSKGKRQKEGTGYQMSDKRKAFLIGIGMGNEGTLSADARKAIQESDCVIGAKRMLEAVHTDEKAVHCECMPERIREIIASHPEYQKTAVLYSGDIGFYSGSKELYRLLKDLCEVKGIPGIASIVYLAAKLHVSWEDARLVSIHGRKQPYIHIVARHRKTFLLLGGSGQAEDFCSKIKDYSLTDLKIWIGKDLSYKDESIVCRSGADIQPEDLQGLAALYVENPSPMEKGVQIRDDAFIRGNVPMTKEEIRAVSLAKLELSEGCVFYDIGAGTGSIAVTAAVLYENAQVYAIERKPEAAELIRQNRRKFCVDQVEVIEGTAPEALQDLKAPTHVFIGGSLGSLEGILRCIGEKSPSVRVVLNAITLETVKEALTAEEKGLLWDVEIIQAGISRAKKVADHHMMMAQNPIYIISARIAGKGIR